MTDIWARCRDAARPVALSGSLLRIVESQEQVATSTLVDDAAEQAMLEEMLEASKPAPRVGSEGLPYLLMTPFRYPPLPHGSRFGSRHEPSLFYGSLGLATLLAEAAYYRFWFWLGMSESVASGRLTTQHTVFGARYRSRRGLRLESPPFDEFTEELTSPDSYAATQALGARLREAGIELFTYVSARDPEGGLNIGLFPPSALVRRSGVTSRESWTCVLTAERALFLQVHGDRTVEFPLRLFLVDGRFPQPAP